MRSEKGFSLLEVMLAIALLGVIIAALMSALSTGSIAVFVADERATAESLAKSQMEYVRNQAYATNDPPTYDKISTTVPPYVGYDIAGYDGDINVFRAWRLDMDSPPDTSDDDGIQKITIFVYHPYAGDPGDWVVKLENYRSAR